MTTSQRDSIKRNFPTWFTVANFVLLIGFIVQAAKWQERVDNQLKSFEKHIENTEVHQTYSNQVQKFIPRSEMEIHLQNMYKIMNEVKTDIKSIEKKIK